MDIEKWAVSVSLNDRETMDGPH
ncbi:uncharacterized protein G2W53_024299 [Senna tora]|uniref:Uncharacterized protein n=1 Tax=Senna tora TaxID=362788 RepID=A0A834TCH3_9FABA|nr:uncharacterized protein G2W53_024299 [Senna tora]